MIDKQMKETITYNRLDGTIEEANEEEKRDHEKTDRGERCPESLPPILLIKDMFILSLHGLVEAQVCETNNGPIGEERSAGDRDEPVEGDVATAYKYISTCFSVK